MIFAGYFTQRGMMMTHQFDKSESLVSEVLNDMSNTTQYRQAGLFSFAVMSLHNVKKLTSLSSS